MAATNRQLIMWEVPYLGSTRYIQMYINPQNIVIDSMKDISEVRTKGGYFLQYWGEKFDEVKINGTTGSSGIEGINVLKDIYRGEQLALFNIVRNTNQVGIKRRQSLAQLAASVVMHYADVQYFGYFKNFSFTEDANQVGLYSYTMTFTVTKTIGLRKNWAGWHRIPRSSSENPILPGDSVIVSNAPAELNLKESDAVPGGAFAPADGGVANAKQQQTAEANATKAPGATSAPEPPLYAQVSPKPILHTQPNTNQQFSNQQEAQS